MGHSRLRLIAATFLLSAAAAACSDADGSCADLALICANCPDTAGGLQAQASCDTAVDSADELACEDRIDSGIYADFGCTAP